MLLMAAHLSDKQPYKEMVSVTQGAASTVCRTAPSSTARKSAAQACNALLLMTAHLNANHFCNKLIAVTQGAASTVCRSAASSTAGQM